MEYSPSELVKLSDRLAAAAAVSEAKSEQYKLKGEPDNAMRETKRAEDAEHFATVCRYFASILATRSKRNGGSPRFTPPTLAEVLLFVASDAELLAWPEPDVRAWFDHFNSNGWKVSGRTKMVDWKAAARNGARMWKRRTGTTSAPKALIDPGSADPTGWREWTKGRGKYEPYKFAPDWVKTAFKERAK